MKKLSGCQRNIWFHFHATFYWQKQQQTNPARQQIYQRIYICIGFEVFKKIQEDTPQKYRPNKSRPGIDSKNRVTSVVKFCRRGSTRRRVLLKKSAKKKALSQSTDFHMDHQSSQSSYIWLSKSIYNVKNHLNLANYFSVVT